MGLLGIPDPGKWRQQNVTTAVTDTERVIFSEKNFINMKIITILA